MLVKKFYVVCLKMSLTFGGYNHVVFLATMWELYTNAIFGIITVNSVLGKIGTSKLLRFWEGLLLLAIVDF